MIDKAVKEWKGFKFMLLAWWWRKRKPGNQGIIHSCTRMRHLARSCVLLPDAWEKKRMHVMQRYEILVTNTMYLMYLVNMQWCIFNDWTCINESNLFGHYCTCYERVWANVERTFDHIVYVPIVVAIVSLDPWSEGFILARAIINATWIMLHQLKISRCTREELHIKGCFHWFAIMIKLTVMYTYHKVQVWKKSRVVVMYDTLGHHDASISSLASSERCIWYYYHEQHCVDHHINRTRMYYSSLKRHINTLSSLQHAKIGGNLAADGIQVLML